MFCHPVYILIRFFVAVAASTIGAGVLWSRDYSILSAGERSSSFSLQLQTQMSPSHRAQLEKGASLECFGFSFVIVHSLVHSR
jgi:hypothetical protein